MKYKITVFDIATIIISAFCLFPLLTSLNSYRIIVIIASIYILFVSLKTVVHFGSISVLKLIFYFLLAFMISFLFENKYGTNHFIHFSHLIVFVFVYEYYRVQGIKSMKYIYFILLGLLIIGSIQTIIELLSNLEYARYLAKNQDEVEVVGLSGGYGLIYAVMLVLLSVFSFYRKNVEFSTFIRFFYIVLILISVFLIWQAGYFLALLVSISGMILLILGFKKNNIPFVTIFLVFLFGIISFFQESISNQVLEITNGTKYQTKVQSIIDPNSASQFDDEFSERESRYSRDIQLIIDYPIVGCWDFKLVGKHSFILDMLAEFGLIFGSVFIYYVFIVPFKLMNESDGIAFTQSFVFLGGLFVFLLLNSFPISLLPVIFIIFPYSNYVISKQWKK